MCLHLPHNRFILNRNTSENSNMSESRPKPVVLLILDGLGVDVPNEGNAVTLANTPNLDEYWPKYCHTLLQASEHYVGLPDGVMGNSEVGHMTIGAGRLLKQEITRINDSIRDGDFFENKYLLQVAEHVKKENSRLHLIGLVSDGRVHSSQEHLYALLEFAKRQGFAPENVFVHAFLDGRDTSPKSALSYLDSLQNKINEIGVGRIASLTGRFYAMDRDSRWDRTELAYNMMVKGEGRQFSNYKDAVEDAYNQGETDEFVMPCVIVDESNQPVATIQDNDAVICFNYRADRAMQITMAFEFNEFSDFERLKRENVLYAGFSNYQKGIPMQRAENEEKSRDEKELVHDLIEEDEENSENHQFPDLQIFPPLHPQETLGEIISKAGLKQLRITESEKYPHATYFFNNRRNDAFPGEDRVEIPSPREVKTYDEKPEMSTYEITERLVQEIESDKYDFIFVNFALTDMVGHTGVLEAGIKAVEVADECLGKIVPKVLEKGGEMIITADHGNIEEMINMQTGEVDTEHSLNSVPLIYVTENKMMPPEVMMGTLCDLAPTILAMMNLEQPKVMDGRDLFAVKG